MCMEAYGLDNEPLLKDPELIITQPSLLLMVIPTFPSGRHSNRIEKVHVIAVQVFDKVIDKEVEAKHKLIRNVIHDRFKKYEIDRITHMIFALEGENTTETTITTPVTPTAQYSIVASNPLQSKPLYSNYIKRGRLKKLIVGDTRRVCVFIGSNYKEKIIHALSKLLCIKDRRNAT